MRKTNPLLNLALSHYPPFADQNIIIYILFD